MSVQPQHPAAIGQSKTCVTVAGMHRSGTSAVARVINLLGADITRDLMPAVVGVNDRGYWESMAVYEAHQRLLQALGSNWKNPSPLPHGWTQTAATEKAKRRLADEITKDFSNSRLFVVKDPRITRLLPLWLEIFAELGIESIVVIPFRNPLAVAASLEKRDGLLPAQSLLLYVQTYLEVEAASRDRPRAFLSYEDLLDNWRGFARRLGKLAAPHFAVPPPEAEAEIDDFLTAELHRSRFSRQELVQWPDVPATVVEVYDRMVAAANMGDEAKLRPAFDRLRAAVEEARRLYKGAIGI